LAVYPLQLEESVELMYGRASEGSRQKLGGTYNNPELDDIEEATRMR